MRHRYTALRYILCAASVVVSGVASAAAFQVYELGAPVVGTAGVGQAAITSDASSAYYNPAGMSGLHTTQYMLGSQLLLQASNFSKNSSNTITGDNGGDAGNLIPGVDLYYVYNYSPDWRFGVSVTSPYGGMLTYTDGWVGRYILQTMQLLTLDVNPVLSYRFNKYVALGGGLVIEYANLQENVALPISGETDGQVNLKMANTSAGVNLGVMFAPAETTTIGIAYRSKISHHFTGNATFLRITDNPSVTTRMVMPHNIIGSISQQLGDRFTLLGELGWSNWASMKNTIVNIAGYSASTPRDWSNTWRAGLGGQFLATSSVMLQAGLSFDSSPTTASRRLPDLPMDQQIRAGIGLIYSVFKAAQLGFSYEYLSLGKASINNTSSNGTLAGDYSRNHANIFQVSINVDC